MTYKLTILILGLSLGFLSSQVHAQSVGSPNMRLESTGLKVGSKLPESLEVFSTSGTRMKLKDLFKNRPVVIVSGCLTCPVFLRTYGGVETVYRDYKDKVDFYYLYKTLAHPENRGYIQPITIDERLAHISEALETLQTKITWLADPMTNEVSSTFGLTPNSEFLFDKKGNILYLNAWSDAQELRKALVAVVGAVASPTTVESLNLPTIHPMGESTVSVIPRVMVEENLNPIMAKPDDVNATYYVKLRAEVTLNLLEKGSGKLYLGFHLDPIHHVHWNNMVDPIKYEITVPDGITIIESKGTAMQIGQPSDEEPREFFIEVNNWKSGDSMPVEVVYYACDANDMWCKQVIQSYTITLEADPFAGGVIGRSFRAGRRQSVGQGLDMFDRLMSYDKNKDGLLSKEELPEQMRRRFGMLDTDKDGLLSKVEISKMRRRH